MSNDFSTNPNFPPPQKKSSAMIWIIILVGVLVVIPLMCCGGIAGIGYLGVQELSNQNKSDINASPQASAAIGEVESTTMNLMATGEEQQRVNREVVVFDVKGSKGTGKLIVEHSGEENRKVLLRLPDGTEIPVK